ncbi:MAG: hypothetical protein N4J56_007357 [Chroococcidiopsis sp. SAG 2025]|uniref:hypothetical protein n=1 Tax=Chroococcidiopsis sp. SAG 2025 TaxID=171389 RepID=UPI0029373941|nr:hypothetical protein [Chroococcidiopsis sp. SAG 2025]MDV2997652.1 hypothetical protein [Chroococcidiopsis sp. SAG 2025]
MNSRDNSSCGSLGGGGTAATTKATTTQTQPLLRAAHITCRAEDVIFFLKQHFSSPRHQRREQPRSAAPQEEPQKTEARPRDNPYLSFLFLSLLSSRGAPRAELRSIVEQRDHN